MRPLIGKYLLRPLVPEGTSLEEGSAQAMEAAMVANQQMVRARLVDSQGGQEGWFASARSAEQAAGGRHPRLQPAQRTGVPVSLVVERSGTMVGGVLLEPGTGPERCTAEVSCSAD